jgi:hypothetical protein
MENTIDLRKTGAENIIGKFSKKNILLNILYLYVRTVRSSWSNIYTWLLVKLKLFSCYRFLETPVVILSIVRIENQRLMSCVKTPCSNLQCLFVLWLKALQVYLLWFHYGHVYTAMYVMSIMADTKVSKASLIEGLYYISVENIWYSSNNAGGGKCTRVYQNSDILGVIAVVLRHRRWVSCTWEFSLLYSPR